MVKAHLTINDGVLAFCAMYFATQIAPQWKSFNHCGHPLPLWISISFVSVLLNRIAFLTAHYLSPDSTTYVYDDEMEDLLLLSDPRGPPKWLTALSLGILFPFFVVWTFVGTVWFTDTLDDAVFPVCFVDKSHVWLFFFWIVVCYFWTVLYLLFVAIVTLTDAGPPGAVGAHLDAYGEENSLIRRWAESAFLTEHTHPFFCQGLTPAKICRLPSKVIETDHEAKRITEKSGHCAICLEPFMVGETIRQIRPCKHTFHRNCVDIWMLQSGSCPNCKGLIRTSEPTPVETESLVTSRSHVSAVEPGDYSGDITPVHSDDGGSPYSCVINHFGAHTSSVLSRTHSSRCSSYPPSITGSQTVSRERLPLLEV